jgi:hypothetical protein
VRTPWGSANYHRAPFQIRFQHNRASYAAAYPTRELAEEAQPWLRAAVLGGWCDPAGAEVELCGVPRLSRPLLK